MKRHRLVLRTTGMIVFLLAMRILCVSALADQKMDYLTYDQMLTDVPRGTQTVALMAENAQCVKDADILQDGSIHVGDDGKVSRPAVRWVEKKRGARC